MGTLRDAVAGGITWRLSRTALSRMALLELELWTTGLCALIGRPAALELSRAVEGATRQTLFCHIILPFCTNGLVRMFSWTRVPQPLQNDEPEGRF
jgi:hypothetical protein